MRTDYCKHMVPLMKNDTCYICSLEAERDEAKKDVSHYASIGAEFAEENDRLRKELEEARKIKFPRQSDGEGGWVIDYKFLERLGVTMLRESDHTIDTEDIELVLLTLEIAVGQEGEGNQDESQDGCPKT
ncbi:hypothetical protein QP794_01785 [Paenibacillus sp. UMB7766-LJ446]|uniref:hypothetical protein n=1 Tax=Paenibacillus sp. UMB7766-LJ446 TaxID=3046313 RepID=UPI00254C7473|nr:hypothetical protein [Paenibacillus sp. UMB7766-LJ446]MDK8188813.1 hypothetical protein [Paenibacillus sp. UMB7766-LJ446]